MLPSGVKVQAVNPQLLVATQEKPESADVTLRRSARS